MNSTPDDPDAPQPVPPASGPQLPPAGGPPAGSPPAGPWPQPGFPQDPYAAPRKGMSFGAGLGIGLAIGFGANLVAGILMVISLGLPMMQVGPIGILWPFLLAALVPLVMMFFAKTRSFATGMLIMCAAVWLIVIGPCILLIRGFGG